MASAASYLSARYAEIPLPVTHQLPDPVWRSVPGFYQAGRLPHYHHRHGFVGCGRASGGRRYVRIPTTHRPAPEALAAPSGPKTLTAARLLASRAAGL
jgi:hypothetical protein